MCFYINPDIQKRIRIAKEDIVCYKEVKPVSETTGKIVPLMKKNGVAKTNSFMSAIFNILYLDTNYDKKPKPIIYKMGRTYHAKDSRGKNIKELTHSCRCIFEGFHADESKYYLDNIRCIIPKGTKYYTNGKEFVAMKIKFVEWL